MSVRAGLETTLGATGERRYRCWECDANFLVSDDVDECRYCQSDRPRSFGAGASEVDGGHSSSGVS